jgi:hypothetical protein
MMEQDLRSLLKASAPVAGLATAVEWDEVKQGTALPYVILEMASDPRDKSMEGPQATRITRVRTKVFYSKASDGLNLREYVIAAVEAATGVVQGDTRFLGIFPNVLGTLQLDTPDGIRNCQVVDLQVCHTPIP